MRNQNLVAPEAASSVAVRMTAAVAGSVLADAAKQSRFRSVAGPEIRRKPARSTEQAVMVLSQALLEVSRELAQLRQVPFPIASVHLSS